MTGVRVVPMRFLRPLWLGVLATSWFPVSAAYADQMNLLAPSYYGTYSDVYSNGWAAWQNLENNLPTTGSTPMVVFNEASGPGTAQDETLYYNIAGLESPSNYHVEGLGYVDMPATYDGNGVSHPARSGAALTGDVDNWYNWYGTPLMSGIFFDDVARTDSSVTSGDLGTIEYVVQHTVSTYHPAVVVINAAGPYTTTKGLYGCVQPIAASGGTQLVVVTVETYENRFRSGVMNDLSTHEADFGSGAPLNWVYGFPANTFAGLVHDGTSDGVTGDLETLAGLNIGVSFVTDMLESQNAWDPGPTTAVWGQLAQYTGANVDWPFPQGTGSGGDLGISCPPAVPEY